MRATGSVFKFKDVPAYESPEGTPRRAISSLIDHELVGSRNIMVGLYVLKKGETNPNDVHPDPYEEVYYVLKGKGILTLGGKRHLIDSGSVVYIPAGMEHQIKNTGAGNLSLLFAFPFERTDFKWRKWRRLARQGARR